MAEGLKKYPVQHPLLKKHIKFFWEIDSDFMRLDHQIIPVRNIDVKFNLSETPHYLRINNKTHMLDNVYFSGLQDHFRNARILLQGRVHVLGICFFPEGFYPFLKIPVSECRNQLLGTAETGLFSKRAIHERLMEAPDTYTRLHILENELLSLIDNKIQTPDSFYHLFDSFKKSNPIVKVSEFCHNNNLGTRNLERMFNKYVGVSAKTYSVLNRFQDSLNQHIHSDYSKLSDIA